MPSSRNLLVSLLGYVFRVGVWEELCKALPLIIYLTWQARHKRPLDSFEIVFIGVASGLGFATFENMEYVDHVFQRSVRLTVNYGREGFEHGVKGAMINPMLRNLSLSFAHAVFAGLLAYFLAIGATAGNRKAALFCVGLAVASVLHGLYDWTLQVNEILPIMTVCFSVMLFYAYLSKLRLPEYGPVEERSPT